MKYILLYVIAIGNINNNYNAQASYERTPIMFGGLFAQESACMAAAKEARRLETPKLRGEGFCLLVNGWDKVDVPDGFQPWSPVK